MLCRVGGVLKALRWLQEFLNRSFLLSRFTGICLAVALSHKLNIKLIEKPIRKSLIVDDVYETGITLSKFKHIEGANFFVLFSKKKPIWWNAVNLSYSREWIVFPWENKKNIVNEKISYKTKRGLS